MYFGQRLYFHILCVMSADLFLLPSSHFNKDAHVLMSDQPGFWVPSDKRGLGSWLPPPRKEHQWLAGWSVRDARNWSPFSCWFCSISYGCGSQVCGHQPVWIAHTGHDQDMKSTQDLGGGVVHWPLHSPASPCFPLPSCWCQCLGLWTWHAEQ